MSAQSVSHVGRGQESGTKARVALPTSNEATRDRSDVVDDPLAYRLDTAESDLYTMLPGLLVMETRAFGGTRNLRSAAASAS
jgi:hypothetical protein